LINSRTIVL